METNKELIDQLREYAGNAGYSHHDYADTMRLAAAALSQRSEVVDAPSDEMVIRGAEVLHDSLRHAGCTFDFDHSLNGTEIQQGIAEAVFNAMIEVMQQKPAPAPSAAAGEQVPYGYVARANDGHETYFKERPTGFDNEKWRGLITVVPLFAAQPTPAQGDAVPVNSDALATMLTVFDMGLGFALCHHGFAETRNAIKDLQKDFTEIRIAVANATRQSSADAVDAARGNASLYPCGECGESVKESCWRRPCGYRAMQQQANSAAIAAQGGKGGSHAV